MQIGHKKTLSFHKANRGVVLVLTMILSACSLFGNQMPYVVTVSPASGATNVGTSSSVRATLNLPGDGLNVTTLTDQSVSLTDAAGALVPAARTMEGNTLVLDPTADLTATTRYTFAVTADVQTADGTSLAPFTSTFTTGTGPGTGTGGSLAANPAQVLFTAGGSTSSDTRTFTLTNSGSKTVNVSSLSISGANAAQFSLADSSTFSLEPGTSRDLSLTFTKSSNGPKLATLDVQSDDATAPNLSVPLGGLGVEGQGGNKEPSLQWILDTYGFNIITGDLDPSTTNLVNAPTESAVGQEVAAQTFTKASPTSPVAVEVLATFGVENNPVLDFGYYTAGDQGSQTEIFSIEQTPTLNAQRLAPVVTAAGSGTVDGDTVTFDPGTESFGLYSSWQTNRFFNKREVFTEDRLNTFDTLKHHVRTYPFVNREGNVEPNAYVMATDEFNTKSGNDYNDIVVIVRNVTPGEATEETPKTPIPPVPNTPPANGVAGLKVSNAFSFPYSDRLVLQKIETTTGKPCDPAESPSCDPTKDRWTGIEFPTTGTVNLQNTGSSALQLSLSFQNNNLFVFPNGESTLTLQPGQTYELEIEFGPTGFDSKGVYPSGLLIQSGGQSAGLQLAGLYMLKPEGSREVYFAPLLNQLFGYKTNLGEFSNGGLQNPAPDSPLAGEEVRSAFWETAKPGEPISVLQIAAFYPCCNITQFNMKLIDRGGSKTNPFAVISHSGNDTQSIYPRQSNGDLAQLTIDHQGAFEVNIANYSSNTRGNIGVRFWPLRDRSGNLVADSYIVAQDFAKEGCNGFGVPKSPGGGDPTGVGSNCDYQDNLYIMENIKPVN